MRKLIESFSLGLAEEKRHAGVMVTKRSGRGKVDEGVYCIEAWEPQGD